MPGIRPLTSSLLVLSLVAVGCSGSGGTPEADPSEVAQIQEALARENGGFTGADEKPDFAELAMAALPDFERSHADVTDPLAQATGMKIYRVVLLWGHLPAAHDADDTQIVPQQIDWTGSVKVDEGAVGLSQTLRFDGKDSVGPRADPRSLTFVSHTYPAVDGLVLRVAVPLTQQTLHFSTTALTADLDLRTLREGAGGVKPLGDGRNGLFWVGFPEEPDCRQGFVFGHWSKLQPRIGKLKGSIYDQDGVRTGRVKGIWGHVAKGDRDMNLFFGKAIAKDGAHHGMLGGTYDEGQFRGLWGKRGAPSPQGTGTLQGFYSDGYDRTDVRGVWLGRWSEGCAR